MHSKRTEFSVGIFMLLGLLALVFLALRAGNLINLSFFQPHYTVSATFNNVGSLKPDAAVKAAGVVVGRVQSIRFDNSNFTATVTINMNGNYHFPLDSSAQISTAGLLGDQYISLLPGSDEQNIQNGGKFEFTQDAMILEDLISKFLFNAKSDSASDNSASDTGASDTGASAAGAADVGSSAAGAQGTTNGATSSTAAGNTTAGTAEGGETAAIPAP